VVDGVSEPCDFGGRLEVVRRASPKLSHPCANLGISAHSVPPALTSTDVGLSTIHSPYYCY
jgi:hypothetical protein